MKPINFVSTLSVSEQQRIRHWKIISFALMILLILIMTLITVHQLFHLYRLQQDASSLASIEEVYTPNHHQSQKLTTVRADLNKKIETINRFSNPHATPSTLIPLITHACPMAQHLKTVNISKKNVEMAVVCHDEQQLDTILNKLSDSKKIKHLCVVSLHHEPTKNGFDIVATITGAY
jgi:type II secretory pathway component PulL